MNSKACYRCSGSAESNVSQDLVLSAIKSHLSHQYVNLVYNYIYDNKLLQNTFLFIISKYLLHVCVLCTDISEAMQILLERNRVTRIQSLRNLVLRQRHCCLFPPTLLYKHTFIYSVRYQLFETRDLHILSTSSAAYISCPHTQRNLRRFLKYCHGHSRDSLTNMCLAIS